MSPTLASLTIPWQQRSLLSFLRRAQGKTRLFWESERLPLGFAGFGVAARLTAAGADRFRSIEQQAQQIFHGAVEHGETLPPEVRPRLFGGFAFSAAPKHDKIWRAFPPACFILPHYLLTHGKEKTWLTVNLLLDARHDARTQRLRLQESLWNLPASVKLPPHSGRLHKNANITELMPLETWTAIVSQAVHKIQAGEMDKVVLSHSRQVITPLPADPLLILDRLRGRYPDCYRFLFEPQPGHAFYGATPELLAEVRGTTIHTMALAGSMRRGKTLTEDQALGQQLLHSPKDQREHAFVVEAVKTNLAPLVQHICAAEAPQLYQLNNIQHLLTPIHGTMNEQTGILPVIEALHPTPAVGGMPQRRALRYIQQAEPHARGWYAAPVGWLEPGGSGLFTVALRSAVSVGCKTHLFAGAGIVSASDPEKEWRETDLKFNPILQAITRGNS